MNAVLVTRPAGQAGVLVQLLRDAGLTALHRPALVIEPLPLAASDRRQLLDLDQFHAVFFVSSNAARLGLEAMGDLWPQWPTGVHWLAVGQATAAVIADAGLQPETPARGFNSEAVLALPALAAVAERRILVCRGEGGRDWLASRLRERGAEVTLMPFYRRRPNPHFRWPDPAVVVLVNSVATWQAIRDRVPGAAAVVAAGDRVATAVAAEHSGPIRVATSAHDRDMAEAAIDFGL